MPNMPNLNEETMLAIEWGVAPLILIGILFFFLTYTPDKDLSERIKRSANSGKLAGLLLFFLLILSQKSRELVFSLNMPDYSFNIYIVVGSTVIGSFLTWVFDMAKIKTIVGLYILTAVALSCSAIYCYLFIPALRGYFVLGTIGMMLGIMIYAIFSPMDTKPDKQES